MMSTWPLLEVNFKLPMRYLLRGPQGAGLVICLHGYQDHALSMIRRIGWLDATDLPFQVLAINAPFPVPIWTANGFKEAYSWYFRDTKRELYIVRPEDTAQNISLLVSSLGLAEQKKVILGFSQGGYLAPFLGKSLKNLKGIIGLGSGYPPENYHGLEPTQLYALHGERDERIPLDQTQTDFKTLLQSGFHGEFELVPEVEHKVDPKFEPKARFKAMEMLTS